MTRSNSDLSGNDPTRYSTQQTGEANNIGKINAPSLDLYRVFEDSNYYPKPSKHVVELKKTYINSNMGANNNDSVKQNINTNRNMNMNSDNQPHTYKIVKSTIEGLIIQMSNPIDPIDYQQFQDFFIVYRCFADSSQLLDIITNRLTWCVDKISFNIQQNKLSYMPTPSTKASPEFPYPSSFKHKTTILSSLSESNNTHNTSSFPSSSFTSSSFSSQKIAYSSALGSAEFNSPSFSSNPTFINSNSNSHEENKNKNINSNNTNKNNNNNNNNNNNKTFSIETMEIILIRTFVLLRHWVLNYFIQDFISNIELRSKFINFLNSFNSKNTIKRKIIINCVITLKKCWIKQYNQSFETDYHINTDHLKNNNEWLDFMVPIGFPNDNMTFHNSNDNSVDGKRLSFYALQGSSNPGFRNKSLLSVYGNQQVFKLTETAPTTNVLYHKENLVKNGVENIKHNKIQKKNNNILYPQNSNMIPNLIQANYSNNHNNTNDIQNQNGSLTSSIVSDLIQSKNSSLLKTHPIKYPESSVFENFAPSTPGKKLEFTISLSDTSKNDSGNDLNLENMEVDEISKSNSSNKRNSIQHFLNKWGNDNLVGSPNSKKINNENVDKFVKYVFSIGPIDSDKNNTTDENGKSTNFGREKFDVLSARSIDQVQYLINMETQLLDSMHSTMKHENEFDESNATLNNGQSTTPSSPTSTPVVNGIDNLNLYQTVTTIANTVLSSAKKKNQLDLTRDFLTKSKRFSGQSLEFSLSSTNMINSQTNGSVQKMSPFLRSIDRNNTYTHKRMSSSFLLNLETPSKITNLKNYNTINKTTHTVAKDTKKHTDRFSTLNLKPLSSKETTILSNTSDSPVNNDIISRSTTNKGSEANHFSQPTSNNEHLNTTIISNSISLSNEFNLGNEPDVPDTEAMKWDQHRNILQSSSLPGIPKTEMIDGPLVRTQAITLPKISKPTGYNNHAAAGLNSNQYLNRQPRAASSGRISIVAPHSLNGSRMSSVNHKENGFIKAHKATRSTGAALDMTNQPFRDFKGHAKHKSLNISKADSKNQSQHEVQPPIFHNPSFVSKDDIFVKQEIELEKLQRKMTILTLGKKSKHESVVFEKELLLENTSGHKESIKTGMVQSGEKNGGIVNKSETILQSNLPALFKLSPRLADEPQFSEHPNHNLAGRLASHGSGESYDTHNNIADEIKSLRSVKSAGTETSIDTAMLTVSPAANKILSKYVSDRKSYTSNSTAQDNLNSSDLNSHQSHPSVRENFLLNEQPHFERISTYISDSDNEYFFDSDSMTIDSNDKKKAKRNTFTQVETKLDLRKQFQEQQQFLFNKQPVDEHNPVTTEMSTSFMVHDESYQEEAPQDMSAEQPKLYGVVRDDEYNNSFKHAYQQELVSNGSSLDFSSIHSSPININTKNTLVKHSLNLNYQTDGALNTVNNNLDLDSDSDSVKSGRSQPLSKTISAGKTSNPYFIVTSESPDEYDNPMAVRHNSNVTSKLQQTPPKLNGASPSSSFFSTFTSSPNKVEYLKEKFLPHQNVSPSFSSTVGEDSIEMTVGSISHQNQQPRQHSLGNDPEVLKLADLPDKSFQGDNPVDVALLKLEGLYDINESNAEGEDAESNSNLSASSDLQFPNQTAQRVSSPAKSFENFSTKYNQDKKRNSVFIESRRNSRLFNLFGNENMISADSLRNEGNSSPAQKHNVVKDTFSTNEQISNILKNYNTDEKHQLLGHSEDHVPFILMYSSADIAAQLTLIEMDILHEIDWVDLLELNMKDNLTNFTSWLEVLFQNEKLSGIDMSIARFNLMVDWIISEIILTTDVKLKRKTLQKFIHISEHCIKLQNFNTVMQIVLALGSPEVQAFTQSWRLIDPGDLLTWAELQNMFSVQNNYFEVRNFMNDMDPIIGCLPFLVLYLGDLISLKDLPDHFHSNTHIINYSKFDILVNTTKSFIQKVQWGADFYDLKVNPQLLSKCVYISCLSTEEIATAVSPKI